MKILLIEDEIKVSNFIKRGLEEQSFFVDLARDGHSGIKKANSAFYDIIILDILLPKIDGYQVCKSIRKNNSTVPILMLTALDSLDNKINGLNAGADDYLPKPFHFDELIARIRALHRRSKLDSKSTNFHQVCDLQIDGNTKRVFRAHREIQLTAKEFKLLLLLAENKGHVMSRSQIAEHIWENAFENGSNVIDVYINYLRKKIDLGYNKKLLHTIIGMGYVLKD